MARVQNISFLDLGCTALSANNPMYGIDVCNDELNTRECFYDNGGFIYIFSTKYQFFSRMTLLFESTFFNPAKLIISPTFQEIFIG